jgi:hypothetical protein
MRSSTRGSARTMLIARFATGMAKFWKGHLAELLDTAPRRAQRADR